MIQNRWTQEKASRANQALLFIFCMMFVPLGLWAQSSPAPQVAPAVKPKAEAGKPPTLLIICKNQKQVRTIRVSKGEELYDTVYTKFGKDQNIGQTRMFSSGKGIALGVRDKLVTSGWSCREVSDSQLTTSETN